MSDNWGVSTQQAFLLDAALALAVHAIYKRFEFSPALQLFPTFFFLSLVPLLPAYFLLDVFSSVFRALCASYSLFYAILVGSIILYRVSPWHPLAGYPGPFFAKVSKFYGVYMMSTGKNHILHKRLHEKYGLYVRIGPNELSMIDVNAISSVLGADGMPKGPMWDGRIDPRTDTRSVIAMRTAHEHAIRRKRWNRAFNTASVKGYEPIVKKRALQLVDELEKRCSSDGGKTRDSIDLSKWFTFFTFDFMGDMVFGGGFELMRDGQDNEGIWTLLEGALEVIAMLHNIPWLANMIFFLPGANKNINKIVNFTNRMTRQRQENGSVTKDLFHHLIDEDHVEKVPPKKSEIMSDGVLAIVAGSDTTSSVLSGLFHYLLAHPRHYKRLQQELDATFPPGEGDPFDANKLAELPFLNAVINESLRLQPPVSTCIQRAPEVGHGGKWLGSRFIPEGTAVLIPFYALFRNPENFSPDPELFWPDRWLHASSAKRTPKQFADASSTSTEKDIALEKSHSVNDDNDEKSDDSAIVTNTAAFIPFSYGPANCAGRNLALLEMRMVVALLMQRFEFAFAQGYDPRAWEEALEDWLVVKLGKLPVVLTPRM